MRSHPGGEAHTRRLIELASLQVYCEEALFEKARPLYYAAKKRCEEKNAASDGRFKYGIGVSLGVYGCGLDGVDASSAYAELNKDGTVTIYVSWEDHGQGADMGALVSAHETLRHSQMASESFSSPQTLQRRGTGINS